MFSRDRLFLPLLPGVFVGMLCTFIALPRPAAAQTVIAGSIEGTVQDSSGAAQPGVTVTLISPQLQVPKVVIQTDDHGEYQFRGLALGTYQVTFEHEGFARFTREDIVITAGFTARVDAVLQLGVVQQSVTVTGETPVIDVTTTRGGGTLTAHEMAAIPNGHTFNDILALTPGLVPSSPSQAGQIGFSALTSNYDSYGFIGQDKNFMDGIAFHDSEGIDFAMAQEVDVKTFGTTAETPTVGAQVSILSKSGSNDFHGRIREEYFNKDLDSSNVDAALRSQGIVAGNALLFSSDVVADLGGPVIHDKLWFYAGVRFQRNRRTVTGYCDAPGPNGLYGPGCVPGAPPGRNNEVTLKGSYQVSPKNLLTGFYNRGSSDDYESFASRFIPFDSTEDMYYVLHHAKIEWQGTLTNKLLVNVMIGKSWYKAQYRDNFIGSPTDPSTIDLTTQIVTGESFDSSGRAALRRVPKILQGDATASYSAGSHLIKGGFNIWHHVNQSFAPNLADGNIQLVFKTINGVPHQPYELNVSNRPVGQGTELAYDAGYVTDTWRISKRFTANLGLRIDRTNPYTLASTKIQGMYGGAGMYPSVSLGTWTKPAPRVGIAFDVTGDGKTVAKASYGRYNWDFGDTGAAVYNLNNQTVTTYKWHDLNHDDLYEPGEVNLSTTGPDYVSVTGSTNPIINRALEEPYTDQVSASLERELAPTVSVRALYVFWETLDNFATVNPLRPYGAYDVPIVVEDPGPSGTGVGGPTLTIYDLNPAYRGSTTVAQEPVNRPPGRNDYANSFEGTVTKHAGRLVGDASFLATHNHLYLVAVPQSPNDLFAGLNQTWTLTYRLDATYSAPHGFRLSMADLIMNGVPGQRTNLFTGLPVLGSVTIPITPFGAVHGGLRESLDIRVGKRFAFDRWGFEADVDEFNILNNNAAWTTSYQSGPTYNFASSISPPRTTRLTATFDF
jgi:hypothetical protein